MHADSSPITELVTDARFLFDGNEANVARVGGLTLPREREYIFRYTKPGYQTKSITFNLKLGRREYRRQLPDIEQLYQEQKLRNMALVLNGADYRHRYGYRYYGYYGHYGYHYGYGKKKD